MRWKTVTTPILLLYPFSVAQASCDTLACDNEYITELRVEANGHVRINTSGDESSLNCSLYSGVYITLDINDANSEKIYAMLLTAESQGRKIGRIRIVESSAGCKILYVWQP